MQRIDFPSASYSSTTISLDGDDYNITYYYSDIDSSWHIDLSTREGSTIVNGVKVVGHSYLFIPTSDNWNTGALACLRFANTKESVGRDNIGIGKDYELIYFTSDEIR